MRYLVGSQSENVTLASSRVVKMTVKYKDILISGHSSHKYTNTHTYGHTIYESKSSTFKKKK
jgi:hypothetical protein